MVMRKVLPGAMARMEKQGKQRLLEILILSFYAVKVLLFWNGLLQIVPLCSTQSIMSKSKTSIDTQLLYDVVTPGKISIQRLVCHISLALLHGGCSNR